MKIITLLLLVMMFIIPIFAGDICTRLNTNDGSGAFKVLDSDSALLFSVDSKGFANLKGGLRLDSSGAKATTPEDLIVDGKVGIATTTLPAKLSLGSGEIAIPSVSDVNSAYTRIGIDSSWVQYFANNAYVTTGSTYNYVNTAGYGGQAARLVLSNGEAYIETASGGVNPIAWRRDLKIDNAGRVTKPYQPAFVARFSGTNNPGSWVVWNIVETNIGNCYNSSNGNFYAPVAGMYVFGFNLLLPYAGSQEYRYAFYKNSALYNCIIGYKNYDYYLAYYYGTGFSYWQTLQGTITVYLNAGEYIGIFYVSGTGATYNDPNYDCFWGYLQG
ncbi:MAG: hypothetical protein PHW04_11275 [Candidatus Wallbacteria bacterium]|nr:hypothetical protein [Candidatus Wallbacteria bacterium]